jgi:hypothetical protein
MATARSRSPSPSKKKGKTTGRCWKGYEPVPGRKPYAKGSCRRK